MSNSPPSGSATHTSQSRTRRGFLGTAALLGGAALSGCLGSAPSRNEPSTDVDLPDSVANAAFARTRNDDRFTLQYRWRNGGEWEVEFDVPIAEYEATVTASRSLASVLDDAFDSDVCRALATSISQSLDDAGIENPLNRVRVVTSFVRALQYATDEMGTGKKEYPKFAIETLVENEGDCEDFATLFAGIFSAPEFDLDPELIVIPGHTGIGLSASALGIGEADVRDEGMTAEDGGVPTLTVDGEKFLYVDPTYPVPLGVVPEPYRGYDVVATYDGHWNIHDQHALASHLKQSVMGEGISDPSKYL
jgi:hypothetical protein